MVVPVVVIYGCAAASVLLGLAFAFARYPAIYVVSLADSRVARLTSAPAPEGDPAWSPAWSPDGSRIAFVRGYMGSAEIYVMNADGSAPTRLTQNSTFDGIPSWAPDGSWIAFESGRDGDQGFEIYVMRSDGSDVRWLTHDPAEDYSPSWSPDGRAIIFSSNRTGEYQLYVMNADSTGARPLAR